MVGVMPPREALAMAEARGLDLIEIAPTASPPTCKIMDYGKWKYENKKKTQAKYSLKDIYSHISYNSNFFSRDINSPLSRRLNFN